MLIQWVWGLAARGWDKNRPSRVPNSQLLIPSLQFGFTLIELIVTISIFVLTLGAASLSMRGANATRSLRQATEEVRLAINQTRALALGPVIGATSQIPGYRFRITGSRDYEIREMDITHADGSRTTGQIISRGQLPIDLEFSQPRSFVDLDFSIIGQGAISAPVSPGGRLNLAIDRPSGYGGQAKLIIYTATGQVQMLD